MKTLKSTNIFIVEDNKTFALALKTDIENVFTNMSVNIHTFLTGETCMDKFTSLNPLIVIMDYQLNSSFADAENGIKILTRIKKINPDVYVIMLTGSDNIDVALQSFKHGAFDYVVKSDTQFRKIINSIFNIFRIVEAKKESVKYKRIIIITFLGISFILGVMIAIQIFAPSIFDLK